VIVVKCGIESGGWCSKETRGTYGCAFGEILGMVKGISPTMSPLRLGMGSAFVLHEVWCKEATFQSLFLELYYSIARDKEALVSDYSDSSGTYTHWNSSFIRAIQDWELESLDSFLNLLYSLRRQIECCGPHLEITASK
jgi:hypothetical protein